MTVSDSIEVVYSRSSRSDPEDSELEDSELEVTEEYTLDGSEGGVSGSKDSDSTVTHSSSVSKCEGSNDYTLKVDTVNRFGTLRYYIYLFVSQEEADKYSLYYFDDALGLGSGSTISQGNIEKYLTFDAESQPSQVALAYKARKILFARAESPIQYTTGGEVHTLYSKAQRIPVENFVLSPSGICVTPTFSESNISGTIKMTYRGVGYKKTWEVTDEVTWGYNEFNLYKEGEFQEKVTITVEVPLEGATEEDTDRTIQLLIVDHSELTGIDGASVYLDGDFKGTTDAEGSITVDTTAGSHDLRVTASGYLDSDEDNLSNETIVID